MQSVRCNAGTNIITKSEKIKRNLLSYFSNCSITIYIEIVINSLFVVSDSELEEIDGHNVHYKPEAIDTLCQITKFNKRELQLIYRGFKQVNFMQFN